MSRITVCALGVFVRLSVVLRDAEQQQRVWVNGVLTKYRLRLATFQTLTRARVHATAKANI